MSEPADAGAPDAAPKPAPGKPTAPWWVPEARVWIAVTVFGFAWHILDLLASHTTGDLSKDTLFVSIASGIFGGSGVLAVIGYFYMASKKDAGHGGAP